MNAVDPIFKPEDEQYEGTLRPEGFDYFVGQKRIVRDLKIAVDAAKQREEAVDHILLYGPPGLGKTSLAYIVAREMGTNIRTVSGPTVTRAADLAALLTNLNSGDILFIDEIHRIPKAVEEMLYSAMEDRCLDIIVGKGPGARSVKINLEHFTLVGATTRAGMLSRPLRDRFGIIHRLDFYENTEIAQILKTNCQKLNLDIKEDGLICLASRSRKTPRVANRLLKRVRDYGTYLNCAVLGKDEAEAVMVELEIDEHGLTSNDRHIIETIHTQFANGPVGVETLAAATGEERETIEDLVEPYLMQMALIDRTPRGRMLTRKALDIFHWQ